MWGLFNATGKTKRTLKDLPKEARILLIMIALLYAGAFLSPVWIGGALNRTIDFSKLGIAWVLVFLLVTSFDRLPRIIFIQTFCVGRSLWPPPWKRPTPCPASKVHWVASIRTRTISHLPSC